MSVQNYRITSFGFLLAILTLNLGCATEPGLAEVVSSLNGNCPVMVDADTRLDAITTDGVHELTYHFTLVSASAHLLDTAEFRKAMWPGLLSNIRVSPEMQKLRSQGVIIRYLYADRDGVPIGKFEFGAGNYR